MGEWSLAPHEKSLRSTPVATADNQLSWKIISLPTRLCAPPPRGPRRPRQTASEQTTRRARKRYILAAAAGGRSLSRKIDCGRPCTAALHRYANTAKHRRRRNARLRYIPKTIPIKASTVMAKSSLIVDPRRGYRGFCLCTAGAVTRMWYSVALHRRIQWPTGTAEKPGS